MSNATPAPEPQPSVRPSSPLHPHNLLVELHRNVTHSIIRTQSDHAIIEQLSNKCRNLQSSLNAAISRERACHAELQHECQAHSLVREELAANVLTRLHAADSNAWLQQHVLQLQNAHADLHQTLVAERQQHESTATELAKLQKWCHHVDRLVDVTRLEEDSKLELDDRSRHIGDIIMDMEYRVFCNYRDCLREKDDQIADLQRQLGSRLLNPSETDKMVLAGWRVEH